MPVAPLRLAATREIFRLAARASAPRRRRVRCHRLSDPTHTRLSAIPGRPPDLCAPQWRLFVRAALLYLIDGSCATRSNRP